MAEAEFAPHFVKALFDEDFRVRHAGSQALLELGVDQLKCGVPVR